MSMVPEVTVNGRKVVIVLEDDVMRRTHLIDLPEGGQHVGLFDKDDQGFRKVGLKVTSPDGKEAVFLLGTYKSTEAAQAIHDQVAGQLGVTLFGQVDTSASKRRLDRVWGRFRLGKWGRRAVFTAAVLLAFVGGAAWTVSVIDPMLPPATPLVGGGAAPNLVTAPPLLPTSAPGLDTRRMPSGVPVSVDEAFTTPGPEAPPAPGK